MVDRSALLADLRKQVAALEERLRERSAQTSVETQLRREWQALREARRTAATYQAWRDEWVTQAAVAWVLGTVFVRFSEDNGLVELPFLAGPAERATLAQERQDDYFGQHPEDTDRDWILAAFKHMSKSLGAALFSERHNPTQQIEIPHDAATKLVKFWRRRGVDGEIVHDFTDTEWDTRFLGDLYADLSEHAKETYALVPTPEFVGSFILDDTLEPAIQDFGLVGLRLIDPVCGSGNFLLDAFHRVLAKWRTAEPATDRWELICRSLSSIHGVDKNPFAVAIARFRLLVAALKAGSPQLLTQAPDEIRVNIAVGDSLLRGDRAPSADADLLGVGTYHVVVGNPPYLTVKDKLQDAKYREVYPDVCIGRYALTVPFARRFFELARQGNVLGSGAGYVGQLTANSFMKREFGRRLIEEFFAKRITLTHVIDTSGAYIPGHGTPTVVLIGRNRPARVGEKVFAVIGKRGEPEVPIDPAQGLVWQSILRQSAYASKTDLWTRSLHIDRESLRSFPWTIAGAETNEILRAMSGGPQLGDRVERIGYFANTGSDDLFTASPASFRRARAEEQHDLIDVLTGSEVRDWVAVPQLKAFFPFDDELRPVDIKQHPNQLKRLWPYRTVLGKRPNYRKWHEWHHVVDVRGSHPAWITFPWVATHNHFALLRNRVAPLHSAPVIQLSKGESELDHIRLVALFNSSAVCFWLKQHSNSKGRPTADQTGTGEPWTEFYEFTSTRIRELPLPAELETDYAVELDRLAQQLMTVKPSAVLAADAPTRERLAAARDRWEVIRGWMVALQEELDWEVYRRYGLLPDDEGLLAPRESVPPLDLGERAFEIVLARRLATGVVETTWFERHGSTPITELPEHWPSAYRDVVRRRIDTIGSNELLNVLERPEFKRRWAAQEWQKGQAASLRSWLLDRCEAPELWYEEREGVRSPRLLTIAGLADLLRSDLSAIEAAEIYAPGQDLADVLREVVADQHVPYLTALRFRESGLRKRAEWENVWRLQRRADAASDRTAAEQTREPIPVPPKYNSGDFLQVSYWRRRGKYDVPNERFISYPLASPDTDASLLVGWGGWDHYDQAIALMTLIEERAIHDGWKAERLTPLIAGLAEVLPWVKQWHSECSARIVDYLESQQGKYRLPNEALRAWRPPRPKRGRPRKP